MSTERDTGAMDALRRIYTDTTIDHALRPRNLGRLGKADGYAEAATPDGDSMRLWLCVEADRITRATFWSDGCAATAASLSATTELVRGRTILEALRIGRQQVLDAIGGLPDGNVHCARQAAVLLHEAVRDYLAMEQAPWKKAYRRG